ncbi:MAG: insulinase family protein [Coriobacteriia bacterium]|nr:insulinase family protein [Coriobacteriia bacterium]
MKDGFQRTTLDNGVTVITERFAGVRSIALGVWFVVGSRDEEPHEAGMSHFLEHLMFKGTPTRSALELSEAFDRLGARQNAFTSKEVTCYYADFIDESLPGVFELIGDMVTSASLEQSACELERKVVIEEIARMQDDPEDCAHELFARLAWPQHTLGRSIAGSIETVSTFGHDEAHAYRAKHYAAENCIVAAAGNVEHDEVVRLAEQHLASLPRKTARQPRTAPGPNTAQTHFTYKDTEQTHLFVGQTAMAADDEQRYALMLAHNIFGGSMSSRLFQEVREKRGLVYAIYSHPMLVRDGGLFAVYAGTRPENGQLVYDTIMQEFVRFSASDITTSELERAKASVKGALALAMESTSRRMIRLAEALINGNELYSFDEALALYEGTTLDEVHAVAARIGGDEKTLAVVGPYTAQGFDEFQEGK